MGDKGAKEAQTIIKKDITTAVKGGMASKSKEEREFLEAVVARMEDEADTTNKARFIDLMKCKSRHAYDVLDGKVSPTLFDLYNFCIETKCSADDILGINEEFEFDGPQEMERIYKFVGPRDREMIVDILRSIEKRKIAVAEDKAKREQQHSKTR